MMAVVPSASVSAWPAGCNSNYPYWQPGYGEVPEAPSASAAGVYAKTCGYWMNSCSGGSWTKGQWLVTSGGTVSHFVTSTACFTNDIGHFHTNTRAQCADYTGGINYAWCYQRYDA